MIQDWRTIVGLIKPPADYNFRRRSSSMDPHDPSMEQSLTTFSEFVPVASSQSTRNELQKLTPFS